MDVLLGMIGSLVGILAAVLTPLIRLNSAITRLNNNLDMVISENARQDKRLDIHGERLSTLENTVTRHETEIGFLKDRK